ncbi:MAG: hypothetical protein QNJ88_08240 [Acidimicrobiia bacterium]|nr:hypothetical protein [Acidimicrobiia bacterium]
MRSRFARLAAVVATFAMVIGACGDGDAGPTTTRFIPPTSEVIFSLTTTTTRPPGPLDPVFVESLGVTVDFPRDWEFATESLRFGRASAAFRADNDSAGLIIVGDVADVLSEGAEPRNATPDDLAEILAGLLNVGEPPFQFRLTDGPTNGTVQGTAYAVASYAVDETDGSTATMEIAVYEDAFPVVFIAVLYQEGFPEGRVEQTRIFESLTLD